MIADGHLGIWSALSEILPQRGGVTLCSDSMRTDAAKRYKSVSNATAMIWNSFGEKSFRRLKGHDLLPLKENSA